MNARRPSTLVAIRERWIDIGLYGVCGGAIATLIDAVLKPLTEPAVHRLSTVPAWAQFVAILVVLATWTYTSGRHRLWGWSGILNLHRYPPLWIAVLLALLVVQVAEVSPPESLPFRYVEHASALFVDLATSMPEFACISIVVFLVGLWCLVLWYSPPRSRADSSGPPNTTNALESQAPSPILDPLRDFPSLREWLRDDTEIDTPEKDRFGHDVVARRIANRLRAEGKEPPSIALIGERGSGKSTMARLVEYHLRREAPEVHVIRLSLWPFESATAAVNGILDRLVSELGNHINVLGLRRLPETYVRAVAHAPKGWGMVGALLDPKGSPADVLARVSDALLAIGHRIVLWIEDFERFAGEEDLSSDRAIVAPTENVSAVRALLHELDRCDRISVIMSDVSLHSRFDLDKIARFVERPPTASEACVCDVLKLFRDGCLNGYPHTVISALPKFEKDPLAHTDRVLRQFREAFELETVSLGERVASICRTPRALKQALRIAIETWEVLPGEIDFYDVLCICAIRTAVPHVFEFVDANIDAFRSGFRRRGQGQSRREHPVHLKLGEMLADKECASSQTAILQLLKDVFPGVNTDDRFPPPDDYYVQRPQGLAIEHHRDNWRQHLSGAPMSLDQLDQAALAAIQDWRKDRSGDLVERMLHPAKSEQVETFVRLLWWDDLLDLLDAAVRRASETPVTAWASPNDPPAIMALWRMLQRRPPDSARMAECIKTLLTEIVPKNIPLGSELLYWFGRANVSPGYRAFVDERSATEINALVGTRLHATFPSGSGAAIFVEALRAGPPWTLKILVQRLYLGRADAQETLPFADWNEFSAALLAFAEEDPERVLPLLAELVTQPQDRVVERADENGHLRPVHMLLPVFDEPAARRFFDYERLLAIFRGARAFDSWTGDTRGQFDASQRAVRGA